ncbi:MAG: hypothetical protein PVH52_00550, partial [bacterium]
ERQLGYTNLYYNSGALPMAERYEILKVLLSNNLPLHVIGWVNTAHTGGHHRVMKGYDDSLWVFVFHDPGSYYGYTPCGPDILFDQDVWMTDVWLFGGEYKVHTTTPWALTPDFPSEVSQGDTFTVDLKVLYPGPYPVSGQDPTHDGTASIALSAGLALSGGSSTVSLPTLASGDSATVSWDVVAVGPEGEWGLGFAAQAIIDYGTYSYGVTSDSIGNHCHDVVQVGTGLMADWGSEERLTFDDAASKTCFPGGRSMVVDSEGTTHIVWMDTQAGATYIRYMKRIGGTWQTPVELAADSSFKHTPCIAIDPDGGVHVAWVDYRDGNQEIYYKSWTVGGGWSADERVTVNPNIDREPCIAADDSLVYIAWEERLAQSVDARVHDVYLISRNALGWSTPMMIEASTTRDTFRPSLAVGSDGLLNIVYERETSLGLYELEKVTHKSWDGTTLSARTGLSTNLSYSRNPSIAAGDDGTLHVVWQDGENSGGDIFYAKYDGIAWQASEQIVTGVAEATTPSVSVDANGVVYVVWADDRHSQSEIYLMSNSGSGWSGHTRVTDATGSSMLPCVCAVGDGSVSVLWTDTRHGDSEIYYRGPDDNSGTPADPQTPAGAVLSLSLPRPQPFGSSVSLSMMVGQPMDVAVDVFDIAGRAVCRLGQGHYDPGIFDITWAGTNTAGEKVSPGVYFVSCKSPLGSEVRRVVMVR